jgi:uncharacterized protein YicC (UPF0701 family)
MEIQEEQKVTISPEVLFQEVSGEMVLLDLASESYFGLDAIGARIWGLLESGATVGETLDTLMQEYEVERETLEADVGELLDRLLEAGLIRV